MSFHEAKKGQVRKNMSKGKTSSKRCLKCGLKVRGPNHEVGVHHKSKHIEN